jgi:hypothetical protein
MNSSREKEIHTKEKNKRENKLWPCQELSLNISKKLFYGNNIMLYIYQNAVRINGFFYFIKEFNLIQIYFGVIKYT